MRSTTHLRLLGLAVLVWFLFWLGGLPDYYQQYSLPTQLVLCALVLAAFVGQGVWFLRPARPERRFERGLWLAFYFTVPFAAIDALYCGIHLGHGLSFLARYWYLTIFYVIPWLLFVPMGWWWSRDRS